uniref:DNA-directed RNA polymerase III subunit RPC9 n=1 Tax=Graphocephala atropunctata TaxID=36148 RepID=A0A1B6L291_9HEMI
MEVKNINAASLCNHEVLHLLNILKEEPQEQNAPPNSHLATIYYETSHFLQDGGFGDQTSGMVSNMLLALKEFPVALTKEEKLMIINYPPTTNLQLSLIVRDADERMTEEQMQELLELIKKHLLKELG